MEYIIVENGIIAAHKCGKIKPENAIVVPDNFSGYVGKPYAALKDDLSGLKPLSQQVSESITSIPDGYKINETDTEFIRMSQDEIDEKYGIKYFSSNGSYDYLTIHKTFDKDGNFDYFVSDNFIEMDEIQPKSYYYCENGKWIGDINKCKELKLNEINERCDSILNSAVLSYPETEVLTFDQQTSEANVYLQTKNPEDAPLLSALALGRGITLDDLVQRVIVKHTAFSALSGYIIGQRQALEDKLDECKTVEDVEAIVVDIKLPDTSQNEEEVTEG